jgi:hypothetical protein
MIPAQSGLGNLQRDCRSTKVLVKPGDGNKSRKRKRYNDATMLDHRIVSSLELEPLDRPTSPNPWQIISSVVSALVGAAALITQWKSNRPLALILGAIALIAIVSTLYRPAALKLRKWLTNVRRNRVARRSWDEFLRMEKRFNGFLNNDDTVNLRNVINEMCGRNAEEVAKICGPHYLDDYFGLIHMRHLKNRAKDHIAYHLAVTELRQMVCSYNQNYVLDLFKRLNGSPLLEQLQPHAREHYHENMKQFRERWVTFLNAFKEFLDKTNAEFRYNDYREAFSTYFEYPKTL